MTHGFTTAFAVGVGIFALAAAVVFFLIKPERRQSSGGSVSVADDADRERASDPAVVAL